MTKKTTAKKKTFKLVELEDHYVVERLKNSLDYVLKDYLIIVDNDGYDCCSVAEYASKNKGKPLLAVCYDDYRYGGMFILTTEVKALESYISTLS